MSSFQKYEVLYYKRKNKKHKSKGVHKLDGYLFIIPKTSTAIINEDDNDDGNGASGTSVKALSNGAAFHGRAVELCKQGALSDDDIVQVGPYEVEIVSCMPSRASASCQKEPAAAVASKTPTTHQQRIIVGRKMVLGKRGVGGSLKPTSGKKTNTVLRHRNGGKLVVGKLASNSLRISTNKLTPPGPKPTATTSINTGKRGISDGSPNGDDGCDDSEDGDEQNEDGTVTQPTPKFMGSSSSSFVPKGLINRRSLSGAPIRKFVPPIKRNQIITKTGAATSTSRSGATFTPTATSKSSAVPTVTPTCTPQDTDSVVLSTPPRKKPRGILARSSSSSAATTATATTKSVAMASSGMSTPTRTRPSRVIGSPMSPLSKVSHTATDAAMSIPASINSALRPYQIQGVNFLWNCLTQPRLTPRQLLASMDAGASMSTSWLFDAEEDNDDNGNGHGRNDHSTSIPKQIQGAILADEMGLGKTLMTITLICALFRQDRKTSRFMIICPSALVHNWSDEFDKWIGKASFPKRCTITPGSTQMVQQQMKSFVQASNQRNVQIMIISYEMVRRGISTFLEPLAKLPLSLLVLDEGHVLKKKSGTATFKALESIPTQRRLLVTATPIQNVLCDLYTLSNFVCPGILGNAYTSTFRKYVERPIAIAATKNATPAERQYGAQQAKLLERILSTFVLRRLQKDILYDLLPPRHELLLFCKPTKAQCDVYKQLAAGMSQSSESTKGVTADALTTLMNLRKICLHPSLVQSKQSQEDQVDSNTAKSRAKAKRRKSSRVTSEDCNFEYMPNDDAASIEQTKAVQDAMEALRQSGKLQILERLLDEIRTTSPDDKVVLVSNFTMALSYVEDKVCRIRHPDWKTLRLDGSTEMVKRSQILSTFSKTSPKTSFMLLLSSKAGGCGLNLIRANRLIMLDPDWNPSSDKQAMARIFRPGQTKQCYIYRLFTAGTVEEVIYQRQVQKGQLVELTVDQKTKRKNSSSKASSRLFTREELQDCFTLKEDCACDTKRKVGNRWPDYSGAGSLLEQQLNDAPLLAVAKNPDLPLTFVHKVANLPTPSSLTSTMAEKEADTKVGARAGSRMAKDDDGHSSDGVAAGEGTASTDEETVGSLRESDEEESEKSVAGSDGNDDDGDVESSDEEYEFDG